MLYSGGNNVSLVAVLKQIAISTPVPFVATPTPAPATPAGAPIIWIVVGVVVGVVLVVVIVLVVYFRRNRSNTHAKKQELPNSAAEIKPAAQQSNTTRQLAMARLFKGINLSSIPTGLVPRKKSYIP